MNKEKFNSAMENGARGNGRSNGKESFSRNGVRSSKGGVRGRKIVRMNDRGQFVMPAEFRRLLNLGKDSEVQMQLHSDGCVEIRPVMLTPISYFIEDNPDLKRRYEKSVAQVKKGQVSTEKETKDFIEKKMIEAGLSKGTSNDR